MTFLILFDDWPPEEVCGYLDYAKQLGCATISDRNSQKRTFLEGISTFCRLLGGEVVSEELITVDRNSVPSELTDAPSSISLPGRLVREVTAAQRTFRYL